MLAGPTSLYVGSRRGNETGALMRPKICPLRRLDRFDPHRPLSRFVRSKLKGKTSSRLTSVLAGAAPPVAAGPLLLCPQQGRL